MSQPIQSAICSFGMSGRVFHAPFLYVHNGFNFYGAWERSKKAVHEFYDGVKSFSTLEEMLADDAIELVIVNTPNYTHYDYTKKALLANKHVLVEKPFVPAVAEGIDLVELAARQGKILTVYHNRRFDSDFRTIRQVLDKKLLGDIAEAEIHFDRFKEELSPKVHKETPGPGTGVLYDLGSHLIDQALQLFGMPDAVFADITNLRPISLVDDYFEILLYYPTKRVRIKSTYVAREPVPSYVFHGTKGSFLKDRTDVQENDLLAGKLPERENWGIEPANEKGLLHTEIDEAVVKKSIDSLQGNYLEFYDGLHDAIRNKGTVPVDANDAINVIRIIEAAFKSSKERRVVEIKSS